MMSQYRLDTKGLLLGLSIAGLVILFVVGSIQLSLYLGRPQIQYSLNEANCTKEAKEARNSEIGVEIDACVIALTAVNLKNDRELVDYDGVGGGPAGGREPLIRIYSGDEKFCYAWMRDQEINGIMKISSSFLANETNIQTLTCRGDSNPPKGYDMNSDTNPTSIVISGYGGATISVDPVR